MIDFEIYKENEINRLKSLIKSFDEYREMQEEAIKKFRFYAPPSFSLLEDMCILYWLKTEQQKFRDRLGQWKTAKLILI